MLGYRGLGHLLSEVYSLDGINQKPQEPKVSLTNVQDTFFVTLVENGKSLLVVRDTQMGLSETNFVLQYLLGNSFQCHFHEYIQDRKYSHTPHAHHGFESSD